MTESQQTILVVDDEAPVRKLLRRCFEKELYRVLEASNGDELHEHLKLDAIDLITLDLTLGREDGLEITRAVRAYSRVPIVMVSGKGELIDTVVGLEVGADDYISKPFELREVVARVRAVLRRHNPPAGEVETHSTTEATSTTQSAQAHSAEKYSFDQWILDTSIRELKDDSGKICELTTGEYDLLILLVKQSRRVLSRDQIMDGLKGSEWMPNDRTIDNQVARLRKKLLASDGKSSIIKTIRGTGYLFTPEVAAI